MARKCAPGTFCITNSTLLVIVCILVVGAFLWFQTLGKNTAITTTYPVHASTTPITMSTASSVPISISSAVVPSQDLRGDVGRCMPGGRTAGDPLTNAYVPPVKCEAGSLMPMGNAVPINVRTQQFNPQYSQIGILTKRYGDNSEILPLMGRRTITSRDKWQYYTVSGGGAGGNLQTKLPVRVNGKNCSGEYGCGEIYEGDEVYVEGFQDTFRATIYESGMFSYIPY